MDFNYRMQFYGRIDISSIQIVCIGVTWVNRM